jgi:hypothetical protein
MYLPAEKAEMVLGLLLEGNSVASIERAVQSFGLRVQERLTALAATKALRPFAVASEAFACDVAGIASHCESP